MTRSSSPSPSVSIAVVEELTEFPDAFLTERVSELRLTASGRVTVMLSSVGHWHTGAPRGGPTYWGIIRTDFGNPELSEPPRILLPTIPLLSVGDGDASDGRRRSGVACGVSARYRRANSAPRTKTLHSNSPYESATGTSSASPARPTRPIDRVLCRRPAVTNPVEKNTA